MAPALILATPLLGGAAITYSLVMPLRWFLNRGARAYTSRHPEPAEPDNVADIVPTQQPGLTKEMTNELIRTFRKCDILNKI